MEHQDKSSLFGRQCKTCGIMSIYVDNLTFLVSNGQRLSNQLRLRSVITEISQFLQDNYLVINLSKNFAHQSNDFAEKNKDSGNMPPSLVVRDGNVNKLVQDKNYTRILGANIQLNMNWQAHLESGSKVLLPGVRRQLGSLKYIGRLIP